MEKQQRIQNWLYTAFTQPMNRLTEMFYFDRRDQQFFSVLFVDYALFDENFEPAVNVTSDYSEQNLKILAGRMKRIEGRSSEIISVPRAFPQNRQTSNRK